MYHRVMQTAQIPVSHPPRRRSNTRARLLEAGLEVFTEHSPSSVAVDSLVHAAGYSRGAFYSNFSTMEEVFYAVFEEHSERLISTLRETIASDPGLATLAETLPCSPEHDEAVELEVIGRVLEALRPYGRSWFILHSELVLAAMRDEAVRAHLVAFRARFHGQLAEVISATLARVGRRPVPSAEALAGAVAALYMASISDEHLHGVLGSREAAEAVLPRIVRGMSEPITEQQAHN